MPDALSVKCPKCGAEPGARCTKGKGGVGAAKQFTHAVRSNVVTGGFSPKLGKLAAHPLHRRHLRKSP